MGSSNIDKLLARRRYARRPLAATSSDHQSDKRKKTTSQISKKKIPIKHRIIHKKPLKSPFKPGVIKISNIPFGFFEEELKSYFGQFGKVVETLVIRHAKTFNIKNYAYVKFAHLEVAKIAADTMNNYMMFDKLLKCKLINNVLGFDRLVAKQKEFRCSTRMRQKAAINQDRSPAKERELIQQKLYKIRKQEQKLAEQGIEFKCITLVD